MRLPWKFLFSGMFAMTLGSVAYGQKPDLNFLNQEIANEISRLEDLLGPGPKTVTGKLGPMPNGGNCTLQIVVSDKNNPDNFYTYTVPLFTDDLCKNYVLETEQDGFIKIVPKGYPPGFSPLDLASLEGLFKYLSTGKPPHGSVEASAAAKTEAGAEAPAVSSGAAAQSNPEVLDLPLAPPLSTGRNVTSQTGCQTDQTYLIFRVNHFNNSVSRFDGCPMKLTVTIPIMATRPLQAVLTPDNTTLIVTSYDQGITFIDTMTNKVTKTLTTSGDIFPSGIAMRNDGRVAYVTSLIDDRPAVVILDVVNREIIGSIPMPLAYPHSVYFSPDGLTALVVFPLTNLVSVIDVLTSTVSTGIPMSTPHDVAFNATGTRAYITTGSFPSAVKVVDTATFHIIDSYPVDGNPGYVQVSPEGRYLEVMDYDSPKIWLIELATRKTVTVVTGSGGGGLADLH